MGRLSGWEHCNFGKLNSVSEISSFALRGTSWFWPNPWGKGLKIGNPLSSVETRLNPSLADLKKAQPALAMVLNRAVQVLGNRDDSRQEAEKIGTQEKGKEVGKRRDTPDVRAGPIKSSRLTVLEKWLNAPKAFSILSKGLKRNRTPGENGPPLLGPRPVS